MSIVGDPHEESGSSSMRVISCDLTFTVVESAEVVLQVVASSSAGRVVEERLELDGGGEPLPPVAVLRGPHGARLHVVRTRPGRLTVAYTSEIEVPPRWGPTHTPAPTDTASDAPAPTAIASVTADTGTVADSGDRQDPTYEQQMYLRPSRYCPSDHLVGFAVAEFGTGPGVRARVRAIATWIRKRIGYVPGSSTVHDSAEDTLLTGTGTCRDFAHLGIALCRATGVPARFAAVYAPGLYPMDFHAVFETFEDGRWCAHDATGLAPRASMVRIATGRDAADTAFASITDGIVDLETISVSATVGSLEPTSPLVSLPIDHASEVVELA